jgi:hypothetical protein
MKTFLKLIISGVIAGFVLGIFLKVVEQITDKTVYTLLMNVDYFPVIKEWQMGGVLSFLLHVLVSIILVCILFWMFTKRGVEAKIYPYVVSSLIIGLILFFTTALSKQTPDILDVAAFGYWMVGHLIYGIVVGWFLILIVKKG